MKPVLGMILVVSVALCAADPPKERQKWYRVAKKQEVRGMMGAKGIDLFIIVEPPIDRSVVTQALDQADWSHWGMGYRRIWVWAFASESKFKKRENCGMVAHVEGRHPEREVVIRMENAH